MRNLLLIILGLSMSSLTLADFQNQLPDKGPDTMGFLEKLSVMKEFFLGKNLGPGSRLPEVKPDLAEFILPSMSLKFIWLGHSSLLLNIHSQIILIDPVFHNAAPLSFLVKRFQDPVIPLSQLPEIHTIVISHDHYDHLDRKTIEHFKKLKTKFITPVRVGDHLQEWGIPRERITELAWQESHLLNGVTFRATPAQHFSGRSLFDRYTTLWASWIIEGDGEKIYYSGDSGYGPHFKEIGDKYGPFDYAFLENGQYNTLWPDVHMQPEETVQAHFDLNAEVLIPVHWGMFSLAFHEWSEPVRRIHALASAWHIPLIAPRLGEVVSSKNHPRYLWWESVSQVQLAPVAELVTK
jgi:L-ascorbate metabolism protein UlaG (beta-lactamase superfamily)